jgi:tRNA(Ile)-lysidine synthase
LIIDKLNAYLLEANLPTSAHLTVAYSGGVDSLVLLHGLSALRGAFGFSLSAIHIHHGLSANADLWMAQCQAVCNGLDVPFKGARVVLRQASRTSLEAQAREARYQKLAELAEPGTWLMLGQHQDDQFETFLLQLKRGAGPKGLASMNQSWHDAKSNKQLSFHRPLLDISQQQIIEYAQQHNLQWCEDESNQDTQYERNFLRHDVIPVLKKRWPEIAGAVSRSAQLCAQQQALLDQVCAEKLLAIESTDHSLQCAGLLALSQAWLCQVVRYWLAARAVPMPSQAVITKLKSEVLGAAEDADPILQWQGWQFRRFANRLYVIPVSQELAPQVITMDTNKRLTLPNDMGVLGLVKTEVYSGLKVEKALPVQIKFGGFSQRFTPQGQPHSKPLKQWFKQWHIPPWQRTRVVQVMQGEHIIGLWLNGQWLASSQASSLGNDCLTIDWLASIA